MYLFNVENQFHKSNWEYTLPIILIALISYFFYILKSIKINNNVTIGNPQPIRQLGQQKRGSSFKFWCVVKII